MIHNRLKTQDERLMVNLTGLFGVYLLIRKRAVLRYIYRLLAVYVSLLANIGVLYQILSLISSRFLINVRDTALYSGRSLVRSELKQTKVPKAPKVN